MLAVRRMNSSGRRRVVRGLFRTADREGSARRGLRELPQLVNKPAALGGGEQVNRS